MRRLIFTVACFMVGCSTSPYKAYNSIPVGADKGQLLDKVGSPLKSRHKDGEDIWTYRFHVEGDYTYKEVHLKNGRITSKKDSTRDMERAVEKALEKEYKLPPKKVKTPPPADAFVPIE